MSALTPTAIKRITDGPSGIGIAISWNNGSESEISSKVLRSACPCATCKEQRGEANHNRPLSGSARPSLMIVSADIEQELNLEKIWPVGNYALGMRWSDAHDSGIYPYSLLEELGKTKQE